MKSINDKPYTEVYAWGSKIKINLDDSFGQLGISTEEQRKNRIKPKICSFNIVIKSISCGDQHAALITSNIRNNLR